MFNLLEQENSEYYSIFNKKFADIDENHNILILKMHYNLVPGLT
jgi:hypothetical protein